jgi:C-terminal processing protease CtpA/Prc
LLKGQVEHAEKMLPKKLFSSAGKSGKGKFSLQFGKTSLDKRTLQSRAKRDTLDAQVQSGVGIIGVRFIMGFGSAPVINRVFPGTPAAHVGLRSNDVIIAVDGIPTAGLTKEEVYGMIVGTPNTPVTVSVKRNGDFQAHTMNRMDFNEITDPAVKRDYLMSM